MRPWNLVFLAGFILYVCIRGVFESRTKHNEKAIHRANGRDRVLIVIVFVGCMLLPVVYLFTPWLAFADYQLPPLAPWCGTATMAAALWLFWRSHVVLGQNWSVTLELRRGHQLVKHGVYRWIRHPMYAAILLFGVAQGLLLENWLAGWSAVLSFGLMYLLRAAREERMMCEFFGDDYRDYMRQTGRLLPRWQPRKPGDPD
jgi:protein-S-isoprenylcysteine O-methyltransferase Ste14